MTDLATSEAPARLERLRRANPAAADLAALCSLAVRVEPSLLRRLRVLLPGADVSAESDLWASDVVSGASVRGIAVEPAVAEVLRRELAGARFDGLREEAWRRIAASHQEPDWHWSLRLEEQVYWVAVSGGPDGVRRGGDLLLAALSELARVPPTGPGSQDRVGIGRWLLGALARLPTATRSSDAASAARVAAGLNLDAQALTGDRGSPGEEAWLPWLLDMAGTSSVPVRVGFTGGAWRINTSVGEAVTIEVPRTEPLVLDAQWHDGREARSQRLRFGREEPVVLDVPADRIELSTLAGDTFRLTKPGAAREPGGFDFSQERARRRPCLGRDDLVNRVVPEVMQGAIAMVSGPPGSGVSVCAGALADALERQGWIVVQHYFGVQPSWDAPDLVATSLTQQLRAAVPEARWDGGEEASDDSPARLLRALSTAADARSLGVAVLLDGVPSGREASDLVLDVLRRALGRPVIGWIVTADEGAVEQLETGARLVHVDLADEDTMPVVRAMLDHDAVGLSIALGHAPGPSDPLPEADALIASAGANPARLRRIIDWLLDQPAGSGRIANVPVPLTVRGDEVLAELEREFATANVSRWLGAVAVALDGFTLGDALRLADSEPAEETIDRLVRAAATAGLVRLEGESVAPNPGLAALLTERIGPQSLLEGHAAHVAALRRRTGPATPYQVASSVAHALGAGNDEELGEICTSGAFLDRRARQDGMAVVDDLRRAAHLVPVAELLRAAEVVAPVAALRPERFVELLLTELRRRGADENLLDAVATGVWAPPLRLDRVARLGPSTTGQRHPEPCQAAARLDERRIAVGSGNTVTVLTPDGPEATVEVPFLVTVLAAPGPDLLAGGDGFAAVLTHGREPALTVDVPGRVTALGQVGGVLAAGMADGTIAVLRATKSGLGDRRVLVGHGGEITVLAAVKDFLLSASLDGQVRVWDLGSGRCLRAFTRHRAAVRYLMALADGSVASADDEGRICWWVPLSGQIRRSLRGHDGPVTAMFEGRGGALLSAGYDGTVRQWPVGIPGDDQTLISGRPPILSATWLPAAELIVTLDRELTVSWWMVSGVCQGSVGPDGIREPIAGLFGDASSSAVVLAHAGGVIDVVPPTSLGDDEVAWPRVLAVGRHAVHAATGGGVVRLGLPGLESIPASSPEPPGLRATLRAISVALDDAGTSLPTGPARGTTGIPEDPSAVVSWDSLDGEGLAALEGWGVAHLTMPPTHVSLGSGPTDATAVAVGYVARQDLVAEEALASLDLVYGDTGWRPLVAGLGRAPIEDDAPLRDVLEAAEDGGWLHELAVAALRDRPDHPALDDLAEPWRLTGDHQGQVTVYPALTPALRASAAAVTGLVAVGGRFVIVTAEGDVLRWDPLTGEVTAIGRHDGPVLCVAALEPHLAVTGGEDRTLRLWDVERGIEHGAVAGQAPFRAVGTRRDEPLVVARHGDGEIWLLTPEPSRLRRDLATEVDLFQSASIELPLSRDSVTSAGTVTLRFGLSITPKVSLEIRTVAVSAGDGMVPVGQLLVRLDDSSRFDDIVDERGRLLVPGRIREGESVVIRLAQEFREDSAAAPRWLRVTLGLVTPSSPAERVCSLEGAELLLGDGRSLLKVDLDGIPVPAPPPAQEQLA